MDEASQCDRIALIQSGQILSINTPDAIRGQFDGDLYAIITNRKHDLLDDLRRYNYTKSVFLFGNYIHYTAKNEAVDLQDLSEYLRKLGHGDIKILQIEPTIEDCFLALMSNVPNEISNV